MTIVIGKNSSGKTALLKLPLLLDAALSGKIDVPLVFKHKDVEIAGDFRDLIYGKRPSPIDFSIEGDGLSVDIALSLKSTNDYSQSSIERIVINKTTELTSENPPSGFVDNEGKSHEVSFKGFVIQTIDGDVKNFPYPNINVDYITSQRSGLERYFSKAPIRSEFIGPTGEEVYQYLIADELLREKKLLPLVSNFYKANFEGWGIRVNRDNAPPYQIELEKEDLQINLTQVGLGMIHALPLVVRSFLPVKEDTLIVIEEPEMHLHPAAHGNLAQRFVEDAVENPMKRYLVETHSDNFVLRVRRLVAERTIKPEDVIIYYVDFDEQQNESILQKICIDENGRPVNTAGEVFWPENIFSETLEETRAIRKAQEQRKLKA